jgi:hypothetical protein
MVIKVFVGLLGLFLFYLVTFTIQNFTKKNLQVCFQILLRGVVQELK